jgi:hypothetical protein
MNTCKTCKHWDTERSGDHEIIYGLHALCLRGTVSDAGGLKIHMLPDSAHGERDEYFGGWYPIATGPDFGCIHWETMQPAGTVEVTSMSDDRPKFIPVED